MSEDEVDELAKGYAQKIVNASAAGTGEWVKFNHTNERPVSLFCVLPPALVAAVGSGGPQTVGSKWLNYRGNNLPEDAWIFVNCRKHDIWYKVVRNDKGKVQFLVLYKPEMDPDDTYREITCSSPSSIMSKVLGNQSARDIYYLGVTTPMLQKIFRHVRRLLEFSEAEILYLTKIVANTSADPDSVLATASLDPSVFASPELESFFDQPQPPPGSQTHADTVVSTPANHTRLNPSSPSLYQSSSSGTPNQAVPSLYDQGASPSKTAGRNLEKHYDDQSTVAPKPAADPNGQNPAASVPFRRANYESNSAESKRRKTA